VTRSILAVTEALVAGLELANERLLVSFQMSTRSGQQRLSSGMENIRQLPGSLQLDIAVWAN
jgi:hypothetical protein